MQNIGIIDIGQGNIGSILHVLASFNVTVSLIEEEKQIKNIDKIIIPGVGHFETAINKIQKLNLSETLRNSVLNMNKPILGICLGMQLLSDCSEEGEGQGLGIIHGHVKKIKISNEKLYKLPIIGWNTLKNNNDHPILKTINKSDRFYFLHSYHYVTQNEDEIIAKTEYETIYNSIIGKENIVGVQFHPEKSHDSGLKIFKNFIFEM